MAGFNRPVRHRFRVRWLVAAACLSIAVLACAYAFIMREYSWHDGGRLAYATYGYVYRLNVQQMKNGDLRMIEQDPFEPLTWGDAFVNPTVLGTNRLPPEFLGPTYEQIKYRLTGGPEELSSNLVNPTRVLVLRVENQTVTAYLGIQSYRRAHHDQARFAVFPVVPPLVCENALRESVRKPSGYSRHGDFVLAAIVPGEWTGWLLVDGKYRYYLVRDDGVDVIFYGMPFALEPAEARAFRVASYYLVVNPYYAARKGS